MLTSLLFDTPDTSGYMLLGYAVFIGLPILFIASLIYRWRNLKRDEALLESLPDDKDSG